MTVDSRVGVGRVTAKSEVEDCAAATKEAAITAAETNVTGNQWCSSKLCIFPPQEGTWATNLEDRPWGIKAPFDVIRHMTEARFVKRYPESPKRNLEVLHGYRIGTLKSP
jgi:hypothetical protein